MGLGVLEDRVMEHVPGLAASGATFQPNIDVVQAQHDISMIRTDLRLREKMSKASSATEADQFL
jgi:hypothetical protein